MRVNANAVLRSWTLLAAFGGSYAPDCIYTRYVNFWPELLIGERLHTKYNSAGEAVSGGQSEERRF